jgi:hypothetical protein
VRSKGVGSDNQKLHAGLRERDENIPKIVAHGLSVSS